MDAPKSKFCKGELVRINSKYPYGQFGVILNVECHKMTGPDGWYTFQYRVLTSCGDIIESGESPLSKLKNHTNSKAESK